MPLQMIITDADIQYAKSILLAEEEDFDDERVAFIKNLSSIDLQACPGSGKTTCLLAKLLIIGRHPLCTDGGVLVLSHTNAAIDEIKSKISKYVPELFQYPNFIGTIQSFVDNFLAVPYYTQCYGHQPVRIDDEIFNEKLWKPGAARAWLNRQHDGEGFLRSLRFDKAGNLIKWIDGNKDSFPLRDNTPTYKSLLKMRQQLLTEGYLCYDDAYFLAGRYIDEFPAVANLLKRRFPFVFIDEMQDTDTHQIEIINTIFPVASHSCVQKIGDQNQAIYSGRVKSDFVWIPGEEHLSLTGSLRLSGIIADTVKNISIQPQELMGNSTRINIKPKIFLFDDSSIEHVLLEFAKTVIENNLHEKENAVFKAIGWVKSSKDGGKKGLDSYFNSFSTTVKKNKTDFDSLEEYLYFDPEEVDKKGLNPIRSRLLSAIVKALRTSGLKAEKNQPFTASSMLKFLRNNHEEEYEFLKLNIFNWCLNLYRGESIKEVLEDYIEHLLHDVFSIEELEIDCEQFLNQSTPANLLENTDGSEIAENNVYSYQDGESEVKIEVTTVHAVKGETHTGTLYLETYYYRDQSSGASYESQRLLQQLKGNRVIGSVGKRIKESQKMAYVGMTRATDLLCFAAHKDNIPDEEILELESKWDIIDLTQSYEN